MTSSTIDQSFGVTIILQYQRTGGVGKGEGIGVRGLYRLIRESGKGAPGIIDSRGDAE